MRNPGTPCTRHSGKANSTVWPGRDGWARLPGNAHGSRATHSGRTSRRHPGRRLVGTRRTSGGGAPGPFRHIPVRGEGGVRVAAGPFPGKIDTRSHLPSAVRKQQSPGPRRGFRGPCAGPRRRPHPFRGPVDPRSSRSSVPQGISAGSHVAVRDAERRRFEVLGHDTRDAMTRQLWGARLLQSPAGTVPDSDYNETWTFTLFPAEPLVDGKATSGTVLKGRVRFRLGRSNRGISSARVAPGIPVP